jgi:hypothetical protein
VVRPQLAHVPELPPDGVASAGEHGGRQLGRRLGVHTITKRSRALELAKTKASRLLSAAVRHEARTHVNEPIERREQEPGPKFFALADQLARA